MDTQSIAPLVVDVRADLERGDDPFDRIMQAVGSLQPGQVLQLTAPFEPVPLYGVLGRSGFTHQTRKVSESEWIVIFTPQA
jgi:uncharacterized protein (DUF2249 family)